MLTEKEIRDHYKHKCNTGYDPLLCVHLTFWVNPQEPTPGKDHHKYYHIDQVVTEDRYVELIQKTQTESINDLTDCDKLDVHKVWLPMEHANEEQAAVFWLKPTSKCKTLTDLFNTYAAKIKILFGTI